MAIYVPIVMYCLRLFIVVLHELHCLPPNYLHSLYLHHQVLYDQKLEWLWLLNHINQVIYVAKHTFMVSEIAKCMPEAVYCCLKTTLFIVLWCVHWKVCVYQVSSLVIVWVSYMAIYVPIVMYCLRLFIVALYIVYLCMIRDCYHITKFRCSIPYGFWDS